MQMKNMEIVLTRTSLTGRYPLKTLSFSRSEKLIVSRQVAIVRAVKVLHRPRKGDIPALQYTNEIRCNIYIYNYIYICNINIYVIYSTI